MKQLMFYLASLAVIISLSSCRSGYVNLSNDGQDIIIGDAGGHVSPERHVLIQNQQSASRTVESANRSLQNLYDYYDQAIMQGNLARADSLLDQIDRLQWYGGSSGNYGIPAFGLSTRVQLVNLSSGILTFTSAPFTGLKLAPGETSKFKYLVPLPSIDIYYTKTVGGSRSRKFEPDVLIVKGQNIQFN